MQPIDNPTFLAHIAQQSIALDTDQQAYAAAAKILAPELHRLGVPLEPDNPWTAKGVRDH